MKIRDRGRSREHLQVAIQAMTGERGKQRNGRSSSVSSQIVRLFEAGTHRCDLLVGRFALAHALRVFGGMLLLGTDLAGTGRHRIAFTV